MRTRREAKKSCLPFNHQRVPAFPSWKKKEKKEKKKNTHTRVRGAF